MTAIFYLFSLQYLKYLKANPTAILLENSWFFTFFHNLRLGFFFDFFPTLVTGFS
jgi:hypothetical protein